MKKLTTLLLLFTLFYSCKDKVETKENLNTEVSESASNAIEEKSQEFKHSLAQWSLHEPFLNGTLDPMNFAKIAKDLGFTGLEYVTQLYPQMQNKENYKKTINDWAVEMRRRSDDYGMENLINLFED